MHKEDVLMWPVLSTPGSAYRRVVLKDTEWLSVVEECNSSKNSISQSLGSVQLDEEIAVTFHFNFLHTNFPEGIR